MFCWQKLAWSYNKVNQQQKAFDAWLKSLSFMEEMRSKTGSIESRQSFHEIYAYRYEEASLFMLGSGYEEEGFRVCEGMKARALSDMLAEKKQGLEKGVSPALLNTRDSLIFRISALRKHKNDLAMKKTPDRELADRYDEQILQAEMAYDDVVTKIRRASPKAAEILYPEPLSVDSLQAALASDECVLEYLIGDSSAYCMAIGRDFYETAELKMPDGSRFDYDQFWDYVDKWLLRIWNMERAQDNWSKELYQILIKPAEKHIAGKKLIIIPDRVLFYFPFEAFITENEKYLIDEHLVKYFQSASMVIQVRSEPESKNGGFIAFGDPVFDYDNFISGRPEHGAMSRDTLLAMLDHKSFGRAEGRGPLNRLTGSGIEVARSAALFGAAGHDTLTFLRDMATEGNVKAADLSKYGYIHFSTHGMASPEFQGLAFAGIPGQSEDGFLTTSEIFALRYDARLVTMSACQTGLGKLHRGEGMTGLTRAAMFAGTPAVLSSLWSVSDFGTTKFMIKFYEYILEGNMSKAEALRQTKLDFIRQNEGIKDKKTTIYLSNPYFWSAFVMYGE